MSRPLTLGLLRVAACLSFSALASSSLGAGFPKAAPPQLLLTWGEIGSKPGEFHFPIGIAINAADEVFVTDHYNNRVQRFNDAGKLLSEFETLPNPGGIAVDGSGNLVISHFPAARLRKEISPDRITVYSAAGKLMREWGKSGKGDGEFDFAGGVAVGKNGRVYVADQTNRRVQVFDGSGKFLMKWGEYGVKPGQFGGNVNPKSRVSGPQFVALDSKGNVYTTEASLGRIQVFTPEGKFLRAWGDNGVGPGKFGGKFTGFKDRVANLEGPVAICIDHQDRVWVSAVNGRIQQFTATGQYLTGFGEPGTKPGQFFAPHGIALDSRGNLYVVDAYNHRIQKFGGN